MDAVVALDACPDDDDYHIGYPKSLRLEVWATE
jgi:uncharacterized protein YcgI (DUF1989 family)